MHNPCPTRLLCTHHPHPTMLLHYEDPHPNAATTLLRLPLHSFLHKFFFWFFLVTQRQSIIISSSQKPICLKVSKILSFALKYVLTIYMQNLDTYPITTCYCRYIHVTTYHGKFNIFVSNNYFILKIPCWKLNTPSLFQHILYFPSQKTILLKKIIFEKFQHF
jgi:hypothetical protein